MAKKYAPIIIRTVADFLRVSGKDDVDIADNTLDMRANVSPHVPDEDGKYEDSWEALCAYLNDHIIFVSLENKETIDIADFYGFAQKHWNQLLKAYKKEGLTRNGYPIELSPLDANGDINDDDLDFIADDFFPLICSGNVGYDLCESLLRVFDPKKKYPYLKGKEGE